MATNNAVNTSLSGQTGTGSFVGSNSPTLITPTIGAATATSIVFGSGSILSVYKQGTFTPTLTGSSANPTSVTYTTQIGEYTQIGNVIFYSVTILLSALTIGAASGNLQITGLPTPSANTSGQQLIGAATISAFNSNGETMVGTFVAANSSVINLVSTNVNAASASNGLAGITGISSSTAISGSGFYFTS